MGKVYPTKFEQFLSCLVLSRYNPSLTYADFVFLSTTKVVITGVSMPFIGNWARQIGTRPSIAIGSAIYRWGQICYNTRGISFGT